MLRRTNEFQQLVTLIERAVNPINFSVEESVELIDRQTGAKRVVDTVISGKLGVRDVLIGVECVARGRSADQ